MKIFGFGCWNRLGCKYNVDLQNVVNKIKENKDEYKFGIILGDNVYADNYGNIEIEKPKKIVNENGTDKAVPDKKFHDLKVLKNGIECVSSIGKKLYSILGNHDILNCDLISEQIKTDSNSKWYMPNNCYSEVINDIKIVVIDTNITEKENIYKKLGTNNCTSSQEFMNRNQMLEFVERELIEDYNTYKHVILCGHAPLISFKGKFKPEEGKITLYEGLSEEILIPLLDIISRSNHNITYFCADTHNFQHNKITFNNKTFDEIVSGTGGGIPDKLLTINNIKQGIESFTRENLKKTFDNMNNKYMKKPSEELDKAIQAFDIDKYNNNCEKIIKIIKSDINDEKSNLRFKFDDILIENIKMDNPYGYTVLDLNNDNIGVEYIYVGNAEIEENKKDKIIYDVYYKKYLKYKQKYLKLKLSKHI